MLLSLMLITPEYTKMWQDWHADRRDVGSRGDIQYKFILKFCEALDTKDVLDYGCGKRWLAAALPFPIQSYDPGIIGFDRRPEPADIVVSHHMLEHIEPECIDDVLFDMHRCTKQVCLVWVPIYSAKSFLPDGRNSHLLIRSPLWWQRKLSGLFAIRYIYEGWSPKGSQQEGTVIEAVLQTR